MGTGKRIQSLREEKNITQKELSKMIDISHSVMNRIELETRLIRDDELKDIANALNVTTDYLVGNTEEKTSKPKGIKIPVLGHVAAGIPIEAIEDIIDYEEIDEVMAKNGTHFGLIIQGQSMEPKFSEGDVIIVHKQDDIENGEIAVVNVNGDDATVKHVYKRKDGIELVATNPLVYANTFYSNKEIMELPIRIVGKVVELRAKF